MKVSFISQFSKREGSDCLVIPFFEGAVVAADFEVEKSYLGPISTGDFTGEKDEIFIQYSDGGEDSRILFLGLGKEDEITDDSLRDSFSSLIKRCQALKVLKFSVVIPKKLSIGNLSEIVLEGLFLQNYLFHRLKKDSLKGEKLSLLEEVQIIDGENTDVERVRSIVTGVHLVRDLVNNNADDATPQRLAIVAKDFEKISKNIKTTVWDKKRIEKEGMGLLLAVNRGSFRDPSFIRVDYSPNRSSERVVIIGKGITYDTGGLSLKPSNAMDTMKSDMSGGAAALGALYVAAKLNLNINVTALVPATENSIGSKGYKPGDVYSGYSGKTVEVENTDAEGRLILADAISYAVDKIKPTCIVDIASLTGAILIALGEDIAGVFSNDEKMFGLMKEASKKTGESIWRLPLFGEYKKMLSSKIADIKNVGGKNAGSITAALFLEEFIEKTPWVHLDIAGTSYYNKDRGHKSLATGFGVRMLVSFLESLAE